MKVSQFSIHALAFVCSMFMFVPMQCCNEALCASVVSKCLIMQLCQCSLENGNCSCCKECILCLGTLWDECCDCVGMCYPRNYSETPPTSMSTVEEFGYSIPSLFQALTDVDVASHLNWSIVTFPAVEELSHHESLVSFLDSINQLQQQNVSISEDGASVSPSNGIENMCTVAYFDNCLSLNICKDSCRNVGASKYRWFHNGCCQCVGPECIDYGCKTAKCVNCVV